jgi:glycosyltransferase involved in cell wall biosynthesis
LLGWSLLKQIARCHEVWALTHATWRSSIQEALEEESIENIHFQYVGLPKIFLPLLRVQGGHQLYYYLWQIKAYLEAKKLHHHHNFQLFHHLTYANDWMVSFIGALLPVPYVRGPGGGAHRTPKSLAAEYTARARVWEKVRSLGQWFFRHDPFYVRGQSRAGALLLCNWDAMTSVPKAWSQKIHLFPVSGVSTEDFALGAAPKSKEPGFHVLSAGSLIRVKGFSLAVKAFKEFVEKRPESRLTIIGRGPEEDTLRSLIHESNLDDKVQLAGEMPRGTLLSEMAACDVVLFPSLRDGGGTVVIEAMSVGKPVVCLDTGGPGMHIDDGCGIKITPSSPGNTVSELASALERLYSDEGLRHKLGKEARRRAEESYHWDRLGDRLMEIYRSVVPDESELQMESDSITDDGTV